MKRSACCLASMAALFAAAAAAAPAPAQPAAAAAVPEEAVQRIHIEDDGARIDELRVRGQNRRITVQPKKGGAAYEVLPADGGRDMTNENQRGAAGKRVWQLWSF
ncbi:hypothetical protein [Eleftheria terrae]|uniref:hypothetical protein n=1 Tax=Eleftheria terrae TaxID=1597781 RepID=UPI003F4E1078